MWHDKINTKIYDCIITLTVLVLWSRFFMNWGFILVNTACEWKLNISQNSYLWWLHSPLITSMLVIICATLSTFTGGTFLAVSKLECKFKTAVHTTEHLLHLFWILRLEIFLEKKIKWCWELVYPKIHLNTYFKDFSMLMKIDRCDTWTYNIISTHALSAHKIKTDPETNGWKTSISYSSLAKKFYNKQTYW